MSSARHDCVKRNRNRLNNNPKVAIRTSFRLPQHYNRTTTKRGVLSINGRESLMRNALYQIALLIAAVGLSGTLFSATLS